MGPGFNKRGGAATVTDKRTDVDGVMTYTVAYTVEGGSEKDLPASLLSARTNVRERRLSSLSSSSAASVSSDERHVLAQIQQLRNTVGELQQCVRVEQWQASCDRQQAAALREKLTALSRDLKKAATLTGIATDFESMNATAQEIVVSAAEAAEKAAAVEAEGRFATKIKALSCRLRAEERARKYAEGAAEQARNAAAAESARLLANVQSLLDDTKHAAEEKHKRTLQKRTVEVQHLTEQVGLLTSAPRSLAAAAEKLGVAAEQQLRPGTGEGASSLNDITGKRTRDAIIRTTIKFIIETLKLASPAGEAEDAAPLVFAHPQMQRLISLATKPASICSGLFDNLAAEEETAYPAAPVTVPAKYGCPNDRCGVLVASKAHRGGRPRGRRGSAALPRQKEAVCARGICQPRHRHSNATRAHRLREEAAVRDGRTSHSCS